MELIPRRDHRGQGRLEPVEKLPPNTMPQKGEAIRQT